MEVCRCSCEYRRLVRCYEDRRDALRVGLIDVREERYARPGTVTTMVKRRRGDRDAKRQAHRDKKRHRGRPR